MAGSQVSKTVAIDFFQEAVLGYEAVSISNYDNTSEPKVQAGAVIEISQELYEFSSEETLTGWSGISDDTQAYIYFVPSGSSCTVIFSTTAPTWSDVKNGWYNGNNRALFAVYRTDATTYSNKYVMAAKSEQRIYSLFKPVITISEASMTRGELYDLLDPWLDVDGEEYGICLLWTNSGRTESSTISLISRTNATNIHLGGIDSTGDFIDTNITSVQASIIYNVSGWV